MKLTDDYKLEKLDDYNLVLMKRVIPVTGAKKGKETWKNVRYYPKYETAFNDIIECELFDVSIEDDLNQIRNKLTQLKSLYMQLGKRMDEQWKK